MRDSFYDHFKKIPNDTIFDAELVNFRTKDRKNIIVVFDVPYYKGKDLRKLPV
jgi:ATP-dependent DNA ligase